VKCRGTTAWHRSSRVHADCGFAGTLRDADRQSWRARRSAQEQSGDRVLPDPHTHWGSRPGERASEPRRKSRGRTASTAHRSGSPGSIRFFAAAARGVSWRECVVALAVRWWAHSLCDRARRLSIDARRGTRRMEHCPRRWEASRGHLAGDGHATGALHRTRAERVGGGTGTSEAARSGAASYLNRARDPVRCPGRTKILSYLQKLLAFALTAASFRCLLK